MAHETLNPRTERNAKNYAERKASVLHMYVLAFQDQHTLPKWNILSQSCYIWAQRTSNNNSFETEYLSSGEN